MDKNTCLLPSEGLVRLNILFSGTPSPEQFETLGTRIDAFILAAKNGMFCGADYPPEESRAALTKKALNNREVQVEFEFANLDIGAFRVLRCLLFNYSVYHAPIEKAHALLQRQRLPDLFQLNVQLPCVYQSPGFSIIKHEVARKDKWRLIHIQLVRRLEFDEMQSLLDQLSSWEQICFGGYSQDILHPEYSNIAPGDLYFVDPFTIEYGIDGIIAAEEAFNGLVNFSAKVHRTLSEIREMEIW